jgi:hypothetical protein
MYIFDFLIHRFKPIPLCPQRSPSPNQNPAYSIQTNSSPISAKIPLASYHYVQPASLSTLTNINNNSLMGNSKSRYQLDIVSIKL